VLVVQTHAGRLGETWHAPASWSEATDLLDRLGPDAAVAGGATYLMWRASRGEPMPEHLVSLHRITEGQDHAEGALGALVTLRALERGTRTGPQRAVTMAASVTAGPAVRTLATLGGNLASGFPQADVVPALLALGAEAHLSDGSSLPVEVLLDKGIDRVILGTAAVRDPALVKEAARDFPGCIAVGIDARDGKVAVEGWAETSETPALDLARRFEDAGVAAIIYTDIGRDGMLQGPDLDGLRGIAEAARLPVIASGGIASAADIASLRGLEPLGVFAAIIGKALYDGRLSLEAALAAGGG